MATGIHERGEGTMPGFTAETSLGAAARDTRGTSRSRALRGGGVHAQLKAGSFHPHGGGLSTIGDYWTCKDACAIAHRACLDGCEGTWATPKGSSNCTICDSQYRSCVFGCMGDIA